VDNTITLCSAFFSELVGIQQHCKNGLNGFIATLVKEKDANSVALQVINKDSTICLIGPNHQNIRLISLTIASG
jgi:hypothetical protein